MPRMASGGPWATFAHADAARTDCLVKTERALTAAARWKAVLDNMVSMCGPRGIEVEGVFGEEMGGAVVNGWREMEVVV
jgi:hypothetical protein